MSMYITSLSRSIDGNHYYVDSQKVNTSSYLSGLIYLKDTKDVERIVAEDYPNQSYSERVILKVDEASDAIRANIKIIMAKFPNLKIFYFNDSQIESMLESLVQEVQD